jgi:hypothetical protein
MAGDDAQQQWEQELPIAPDFAKAFGARLRQVREGRQPPTTTEEIAQAAQDLGLSWHRTTVGQIEWGNRAVTAVELLLLPRIYVAPLQDLLPAETTWITGQTAVSHKLLRLLMTMTSDQFRTLGPQDLFRDGPDRWNTKAGRRRPEPRAMPDEVEVKAAGRLGTTPHLVADAARKIWGHGLSGERDRRLQERGQVLIGKRALQAARGHVTRALLKELEPAVRELEQRGSDGG